MWPLATHHYPALQVLAESTAIRSQLFCAADPEVCANAEDIRHNQCSWAAGRCTGARQPDPCAADPSPCCSGITNATEVKQWRPSSFLVLYCQRGR